MNCLQVINILKGDMSFIGPRPDTPMYLDKYTEEERIVLTVRPGITGYNQAVNRNSVLTKEKLKNDIYYVKHLSIRFDIKILFMTVATVLGHKNINRTDTDTENIYILNSNETVAKKETVEKKIGMKKIMILGASILQLPAIQKAKEMDLDVIAVDMNPEAVGFRIDGIKKEVVSTIDIPAVMEAAQKHQIDGIMTLASDMPMRTVAAVAEKMNLIGIDYDTAIKATNKAEMRKALKENNVPFLCSFK